MKENILGLIKPADIITLVNALLGFASIIMIIDERIETALVLVLIAVIADGADGALARYSGYGILGENLDSLSDVISFGVAPASAAFVSLDNMGYFAGVFAGLFLVCGVLRLARFNVAGKKEGFEGIPITAGGFIVALFLLMKDYVPYSEHLFVFLLIILSLLMVSTVDYPKLKSPVLIGPLALLTVFDIAFFYMGYSDAVKAASLLLFILIFSYVLSPMGRRYYDRNQ
jgi:archaetidylserine synthase